MKTSEKQGDASGFFKTQKRPLVFFLAVLLLSGCAAGDIKKICFKDACVESEIADSQDKRAKGLMFRESLASGRGMFFVFPRQDRYSFWMKNMRFALDIIWIGEDKSVVDISANVPVCNSDYCDTVSPKEKAKFVLEVNSGFAARHNIRIRDKVIFKQ